MDKKSGFLASVCALNAALSDSVTLVYYGLQAPTLSSPAPAHCTLHLRLSSQSVAAGKIGYNNTGEYYLNQTL